MQKPPARPPAAAATVAREIASAKQQVALGNISAARAMLEQIDDSHSGEALLLLGETYDPARLRALGAIGTKPDPARAASFYGRAAERGNKTAADRLSAMRQSNSR
jgi:TPR repeat protein